MAKVKKGKAVTASGYGRRGRKPGKPVERAGRTGVGRKTNAAETGKAAKKSRAGRKVAKKSRAGRKVAKKTKTTRGPADPRPARYAVRALDPLRLCGDGTSVQRLFRVDETVDGRTAAHLVFYDRHGWYCEHGRTCPAVAQARAQNGRMARGS